MIEPYQRFLDARHHRNRDRHLRPRGPGQHDDRQAEAARRRDLAIGRGAAAVLGNDDVDTMLGKKFAFVGTGGVRGTNAQKYGYGGNTVDWEARAFGGLAFPIPIKGKIVVAPALEVNQEPRYIKYIPAAHFPTDLIYAVRVSRYPDSKWTFDVGTGHLGATVARGLNIKVNNAIAIAADFHF